MPTSLACGSAHDVGACTPRRRREASGGRTRRRGACGRAEGQGSRHILSLSRTEKAAQKPGRSAHRHMTRLWLSQRARTRAQTHVWPSRIGTVVEGASTSPETSGNGRAVGIPSGRGGSSGRAGRASFHGGRVRAGRGEWPEERAGGMFWSGHVYPSKDTSRQDRIQPEGEAARSGTMRAGFGLSLWRRGPAAARERGRDHGQRTLAQSGARGDSPEATQGVDSGRFGLTFSGTPLLSPA